MLGGGKRNDRLSSKGQFSIFKKIGCDQHNHVPNNSLTSLLLLSSHTSQEWWTSHCFSQCQTHFCLIVSGSVSSSWIIFLHMACSLTSSDFSSNSTFSAITLLSILCRTATLIFILALLSFLPCFIFLNTVYQYQTHNILFICFVSSTRIMFPEE